MNLINRTQANLFIQTVRGKMIASILHLVSRHLSFSLPSFFSPLCIQWFWQMLCVRARLTFVLGGCLCVCVCVCVCVCARMAAHAESYSFTPERFNTTSHPPLFSTSIFPLLPPSLHWSPAFFSGLQPPDTLLPSRFLLSPPLSQLFRVGGAGRAARSSWQDAALGMREAGRAWWLIQSVFCSYSTLFFVCCGFVFFVSQGFLLSLTCSSYSQTFSLTHETLLTDVASSFY